MTQENRFYIIGVDGGASKTQGVLFTETGQTLASARDKGSNLALYAGTEADRIKQIINNLKEYINKNGILIIGIDHYAENIPSLNWDEEYNISTNTFTINQWENFLIDSDLDDIIMCQYGPNKEWKGTLILLGNKKT